MVSRSEAGLPPRVWSDVGVHRRAFCHHTVTPWAPGIIGIMRQVEAIAVSRGFNGTSYDHVIPAAGPDADKIGVGRGYGKLGAHTLGYNAEYGAAWACDCSNVAPTDRAVSSMAEAISIGIFFGKIAPAPPIDPHSAVYATACCGDGGRSVLPAVRRQVQNGTPTPPTPPPKGGFMADLSEPEQQELLTAARAIKHAAGVGNPSPWLPDGLWDAWQKTLEAAVKATAQGTIVYEQITSDEPASQHDPFKHEPLRHWLKDNQAPAAAIDTEALAVSVVSEMGEAFAAGLASDLAGALNDRGINVDVSIGDGS